MLRIITSILLVSATFSSASFAASQAEAPVEAAKIQEVPKIPVENPTKTLGQSNPASSPTPAVVDQKQVAAQIEIKLDENPVPLFPTNEKQDSAKPVAAANTETTAPKETQATVVTPKVDNFAKSESQTQQTQADAATDLKLVEFVLANQVVSREPKEIVEGFSVVGD